MSNLKDIHLLGMLLDKTAEYKETFENLLQYGKEGSFFLTGSVFFGKNDAEDIDLFCLRSNLVISQLLQLGFVRHGAGYDCETYRYIFNNPIDTTKNIDIQTRTEESFQRHLYLHKLLSEISNAHKKAFTCLGKDTAKTIWSVLHSLAEKALSEKEKSESLQSQLTAISLLLK